MRLSRFGGTSQPKASESKPWWPPSMSALLLICAIGEAVTGLALVTHPALVVRLLFGTDIAAAGAIMGRIAGMSLIGLGAACWPEPLSTRAAVRGMTTYSLLVTVYLVSVGWRGEWVGPLLWPASVLHLIVTLLLASMCFAVPTGDCSNPGIIA